MRLMRRRRLDAVVVFGQKNILSLTGVDCDNGCLVADDNTGYVAVTHGTVKPDGTSEIITEKLPALKTGGHWAYQMAEITRRITAGEPAYPTIDDGIHALKVTLAAYESSRTGRRIEIQ